MKNSSEQQGNESVEFFGAEELRGALEDYAQTTEQLLVALHTSAQAESEESINWRPHLSQMQAALDRFRKLCRAEIEKIGLWCEDTLDPEEVHEVVWDEGDRLVRWLQRMMGTSGS
ncbi:MAG TPA: hypothetical protein VF511_00400 [Chthoniobacterales bacterium]